MAYNAWLIRYEVEPMNISKLYQHL